MVPIALLWFIGCATGEERPAPRAITHRPPNIIFILADDLGYGDLGCYGQERIRTPNLDRMAAEGTRFTQCYAGSTVCAPSRCSLMTGLHMGHARVRGNASRTNALAQALRSGDLTVATLLKNAGYTTALIGKWGLGDVGIAEAGLPRRQGFDYFFGYLNQVHAHNYYPSFLWRNEQRVQLRNIVPKETVDGAGVSTNKLEYSPDLITEEALQFIGCAKERPFFLYFATTLPHANNEAGTNGLEVPNLGEYRDLDWTPAQKAYAAMVTRLDHDVGRILALLKELTLDEDTIVFFSSDNGPHKESGNNPAFHRSSGALRGIKRDLYEGGIRVPMIVRWPGRIPAGRVSEQVWAFWDFLPTAAELARTSARRDTDGISILPTLLGQPQRKQHTYLYWEFFEGGFKNALRAGKWKAIKLGSGQPLELYNLETDPGEKHNVAVGHPLIVRRLARQLKKARVDSSDWPVRSVAKLRVTVPMSESHRKEWPRASQRAGYKDRPKPEGSCRYVRSLFACAEGKVPNATGCTLHIRRGGEGPTARFGGDKPPPL